MQLVASLLLLQGSALAVHSASRAASLPRRSSPANYLGSNLHPRQSCDDGQECADTCIPMDAMCCDVIVGISCEAGETCTTQNTCCGGNGLDCDNDVSMDADCTDDETLCGINCMPSGAECCDDTIGSFCYSGTTCLSSLTCDLTGGNNSDDDDNEDDDNDSSSDDSLSFGDDDDDDDDDDSSSDDNSSSNDNSSSDDNDDSSSSDNNSSNNENNDSSNGNGNGNNNDTEDAGISIGPSMVLVVLGATFTLFL